jgi:hypothetical protein
MKNTVTDVNRAGDMIPFTQVGINMISRLAGIPSGLLPSNGRKNAGSTMAGVLEFQTGMEERRVNYVDERFLNIRVQFPRWWSSAPSRYKISQAYASSYDKIVLRLWSAFFQNANIGSDIDWSEDRTHSGKTALISAYDTISQRMRVELEKQLQQEAIEESSKVSGHFISCVESDYNPTFNITNYADSSQTVDVPMAISMATSAKGKHNCTITLSASEGLSPEEQVMIFDAMKNVVTKLKENRE